MNRVRYHDDVATIEIMVPKHLAEWLEIQAKKENETAGRLIRKWIEIIRDEAVQKATR